MAIIIRESKEINGKFYEDLRVFKSDKFPISKRDEDDAEKTDLIIKNKVLDIKKEVTKTGLINLKGSKGVINLWYYVGTKLQFVDDPIIIKPNDKKYIWLALWYHAKDLAPGEAKTRAGTNRDHFLNCYRVAKYEIEFVMNAGTWRDWTDLFDSPILSNNNILTWFESKIEYIRGYKIKGWLRNFVKLIRNEYKNRDLSFLDYQTISTRCDELLEKFLSNNT